MKRLARGHTAIALAARSPRPFLQQLGSELDEAYQRTREG
ncbi:MAG: hypothetical protein QOI48_1124 [Solirubrobacteraceae bacterium]|jgi:hypothetical protein|nr:hypothetical protein [Solirubrobacteraceae bacterium]